MQRKPKRRRDRLGQAERPPSVTPAGDPETLTPDEHAVVYRGWFGLSRTLASDFEPYGSRSRDESPHDCSCGCRYFVPLAPPSLSKDWGCCLNKKSPRAGLLTFEHQGCREFEYGPAVSE